MVRRTRAGLSRRADAGCWLLHARLLSCLLPSSSFRARACAHFAGRRGSAGLGLRLRQSAESADLAPRSHGPARGPLRGKRRRRRAAALHGFRVGSRGGAGRRGSAGASPSRDTGRPAIRGGPASRKGRGSSEEEVGRHEPPAGSQQRGVRSIEQRVSGIRLRRSFGGQVQHPIPSIRPHFVRDSTMSDPARPPSPIRRAPAGRQRLPIRVRCCARASGAARRPRARCRRRRCRGRGSASARDGRPSAHRPSNSRRRSCRCPGSA